MTYITIKDERRRMPRIVCFIKTLAGHVVVIVFKLIVEWCIIKFFGSRYINIQPQIIRFHSRAEMK